MTRKTISAQVIHGHLQHEEFLGELEGQHVLATLTVVPSNNTGGKDQIKASPDNLGEELDSHPSPPSWLDVENDVYFPISPPEILLEKVSLKTEPGQPCIILPEELPDE